MTQINIRVDPEIDALLSYLASRRHVPKAIVAREFLLENLTQKIFPLLLEDYEKGKISLKKIIQLTNLTPDDVIDKIAELKIEPPIPPEIDDYTKNVVDRFLAIESPNRNKKQRNDGEKINGSLVH
ncbi:MAG: hypothetical protein RBG13Loki_1422 [Promethearchaeota archaeon CR_4]|nr:MAG: hypothetical protein RBG13Loki_1422 [Candidatus Lokiarchaeota archaeon CR_4]